MKWNSTFPNITYYRVTVYKGEQIFLENYTRNNSIYLPAYGWNRTNYTLAVRTLNSSVAADSFTLVPVSHPISLVLDLDESKHIFMFSAQSSH